jgi:hypothetical protein
MSSRPLNPEALELLDRFAEAHGLSVEDQIGIEDRTAVLIDEQRTADAADRNGPQQRHEHADRAREIAILRAKLRPRVDEVIGKAAATLRGGRTADWRSFWDGLAVVGRNLELDERLAEREREHRKAAYVVHEPPPYGPKSPHSWAADIFAVNDQTVVGLPSESVRDAEERLAKHARDVGVAFYGTSLWSKDIQGVFRDQTRRDDPQLHRRLATEAQRELRAIGTGGGSTATASSQGAAFVPPAFVLDAWARFRGEGRPFAEQCKKLPLPSFGVNLYVPFWSSVDKVTKQTRGARSPKAARLPNWKAGRSPPSRVRST